MTKVFDRLLALIVLFPALFWLAVYTVLRNKEQVTYLMGFIAFLIKEIKGKQVKRRVYP